MATSRRIAGAPAGTVILASRSPRRQDGMRALALPFEVAVSHVELTLPPLPDPCDPVPVAAAKVLDIARLAGPGRIVLGADTIVADGRNALGKPVDAEDAVAMLLRLRGREHAVRTGVALAIDGQVLTAEVEAPVRMRTYAEGAVRAYVATGEPLDCAGSYDARGGGAALVEPVTGCVSGVVGFPLVAITRLLMDAAGVAAPVGAFAACEALCGIPCLARDARTASACEPRPAAS